MAAAGVVNYEQHGLPRNLGRPLLEGLRCGVGSANHLLFSVRSVEWGDKSDVGRGSAEHSGSSFRPRWPFFRCRGVRPRNKGEALGSGMRCTSKGSFSKSAADDRCRRQRKPTHASHEPR